MGQKGEPYGRFNGANISSNREKITPGQKIAKKKEARDQTGRQEGGTLRETDYSEPTRRECTHYVALRIKR